MDFVSTDIISGLPDPLISQILSFLPTKEAASTSVLSKRWRFLFGSVTNLDFDDSVYLHSREGNQARDESETPTSFIEFVDRVLALQGNGTVNQFSLSCGDGVDPACVSSWIFNVLGRGVSDLDLNLLEFEYPLPSKLFVSKALVKLRLGQGDGLIFTFDVEDVFLPRLKTLYLDSLVFEEGDVGFAKLLSGCPVLEDLVLMNLGWDFWKSCSISIPTLKRLTFFCEDMDENPKSVSFDTPNLVYLEYCDTIADKYPKVNFDSLIEAHIGLRLTEDQSADANFPEDDDYFSEGDEEKEMVGNATDFLLGIRNVQILFLSAEALEVLTFCCEATPVFNNLVQLTIESNSEIGWESLPGLLKNCPNLETLVIKGLDHKHNDGCGNVCCCKRLEKIHSCLLFSPVKVLKIFMSRHIDDDGMDIGQIKHFLEKMPDLEQLIVYYNTSYDHAVFELSKRLQKIPRIASPKCKIQVISENLSLSSTLPSSLSKKWSAPPEEEYTWFLNPLS